MRHHYVLASVLTSAVVIGSSAPLAHAGLIVGFPTHGPVDVTSQFNKIEYNATTHLLTILGTTDDLTINNGAPTAISPTGVFSLTITVSNAGVPNLSAGTNLLSVTGSGGTNLFHSTTLVDFGSGSLDQFQFEFTEDTGTLGSPSYRIFIDAGDTGIAEFSSIPTYTANFSNDGAFGETSKSGWLSTSADTFVPEPASASMLGLAAVGLLARRRKAKS